MVRVARSSTSRSASGSVVRYFRRSRSAANWIGVKGFLISCASRRATSLQALSRCVRATSPSSSQITTCPLEPAPDRPVPDRLLPDRPESGKRAPRSKISCLPNAASSAISARHSRASVRACISSISVSGRNRECFWPNDSSDAPNIWVSGTSNNSLAAALAPLSFSPSRISTPERMRSKTVSRKLRSAIAWTPLCCACSLARSKSPVI